MNQRLIHLLLTTALLCLNPLELTKHLQTQKDIETHVYYKHTSIQKYIVKINDPDYPRPVYTSTLTGSLELKDVTDENTYTFQSEGYLEQAIQLMAFDKLQTINVNLGKTPPIGNPNTVLKGKVLDENGNPARNINVISGATTSITNEAGQYELSITSEANTYYNLIYDGSTIINARSGNDTIVIDVYIDGLNMTSGSSGG